MTRHLNSALLIVSAGLFVASILVVQRASKVKPHESLVGPPCSDLISKGSSVNMVVYCAETRKSLESISEDNLNLIDWAIIEGRFDIVQGLIAAGADVNRAVDHEGRRRLYFLVQKHDHKAVKGLLSVSKQEHRKHSFPDEELSVAIRNTDEEMIKILMKSDFKLFGTDEFGKQPYDWVGHAEDRDTYFEQWLIDLSNGVATDAPRPRVRP
jgi:hypothetical protein